MAWRRLCRAIQRPGKLQARWRQVHLGGFSAIGQIRRIRPIGLTGDKPDALDLRVCSIRVGAVINDPHLFQCHQPTFHHFIEHRQERFYFLFGIDHLDH